MKLSGRVWKFGDNLGATDIVSAEHDKLGMGHKWTECANHVLEDIDHEFPRKVQQGDILVAGLNFGIGHAHYYTAAIKGAQAAGISALLSDSMGALFKRAAIDLGMLAWPLSGISDLVETGDQLELDLGTGEANNLTTGKTAQFKPVSPIILEIIDSGGSSNWALRRISRSGEITLASPAE